MQGKIIKQNLKYNKMQMPAEELYLTKLHVIRCSVLFFKNN